MTELAKLTSTGQLSNPMELEASMPMMKSCGVAHSAVVIIVVVVVVVVAVVVVVVVVVVIVVVVVLVVVVVVVIAVVVGFLGHGMAVGVWQTPAVTAASTEGRSSKLVPI